MGRYKRIFAALDGATTQHLVAEHAYEIAAREGASILFGHVVDSAPFESTGIDYEALCETTKERIEEDLAEVFEQVRNCESIPEAEFQVRAGRINDTLVNRMLEPYDPDLVICGERGFSNFRYAFVGSVSTNLIHMTSCDILVIKKPKDQK